MVQWLESVGLDTSPFTNVISWEEAQFLCSDMQALVVEKTLLAVRAKDVRVLGVLAAVTAYLGEVDEPQKSDAIFVFGSKSISRIETAVGLYSQGFSPRIVISGGAPIYEVREQSEAIIYADWATAHGVPRAALTLHDGAVSIADNVRGGLNTMDSEGVSHDSLILVIAWFALRRAWAHMQKYTEQGTVLYRVAAPVTVGGDFDPQCWYLSETGIKTIYNEFVKLKVSEALNSS